MGFKDLFKPKYQHSDPKVRQEAVKELTDPEILADIALNDTDSHVRFSAVDNPYLTNHIVLGNVIKKEDTYSSTRKKAEEKLEKIIENSINQDILGDIAKNNPYYRIRDKAVEKITSEDLLTWIAFNDKESDVRRSAINNPNLTKQDVLIQSAKNDTNKYVRFDSLKKISNQDTILEIVKNEKDAYLRQQVISEWSDKDKLTYFANNDDDIQVRNIALYKLKELNLDKVINSSEQTYNDDLREFEKLNITTESIYDLGSYDVLIILDNGTNLTDWSEVTDTNRIKFISENLSNADKIVKQKYAYTDKIVGYEDYQDPATDYWHQKEIHSYEFNQINSIVISGITKSITDLGMMFTSSRVQTISFNDCDVSNVENINGMFSYCGKLKYLYGLDSWNINKVDYLYRLLSDCTSLDKKYYPKWYDEYDLPPVNEIDNEDTLIKIAENDLNWMIRSEAVEKISDENVLMDLMKTEANDDIRCKIVEQINNEELLLEIAKNDSNNIVRQKCYQKINPEKISDDLNYLVDVAKHGEHSENVKAALKIHDETALIDIAKNAGDRDAKIAAIEKITVEKVLKDILEDKKENRDVRIAAAKQIKNEELLFDVAKDVYVDYNVRIECVKKITNPDVLNSIAKTNLNYDYDKYVREGDDSVRTYAIEKVKNSNILKSIINSRTRDKIKREAFKNLYMNDMNLLITTAKSHDKNASSAVKNPSLTDENILLDIAENGKDKYAVSNAVSKIHNQNILMKLLKSENTSFRQSAIEGITDKKVLEQYAQYDPDSATRYNAVANPNFTNEELLKSIATNDSDKYVRISALNKVTESDFLRLRYLLEDDEYLKRAILSNPNFKEEDILIDVATNASHYSDRKEAVRNPNLKNQEVILSILKNDKDFIVKEQAIKRITDYDMLLKVLKEEESKFVRREAVELLNKEDLIYLVNNDIDADVREKAREELEKM